MERQRGALRDGNLELALADETPRADLDDGAKTRGELAEGWGAVGACNHQVRDDCEFDGAQVLHGCEREYRLKVCAVVVVVAVEGRGW